AAGPSLPAPSPPNPANSTTRTRTAARRGTAGPCSGGKPQPPAAARNTQPFPPGWPGGAPGPSTPSARGRHMKATMQDHLQSPEAAGWLAALAYKFLPGALGALIMVMVDVPETRRDLFIRLFVAFVASVILGEVVFDYLRTWSAL